MQNNSDSLENLAADAIVTAGLLEIGRSIALFSGAVLLLGMTIWVIGHDIKSNVFFLSIALALLQAYFALRVRFDAIVFNFWASRWKGSSDPAQDMQAFDTRVGRQASTAASVQVDLEGRRRGALRLLRYQALSGLLQLILTVIALWP